MKIRPLNDRVVVLPEEDITKTAGGIVLPGKAAEKSHRGKVIAIGSGHLLQSGHREPLEVRKGDTVIYSQYSGNKIRFDDEEFLIICENDIFCVIEE